MPAHANVLKQLRAELGRICDPEAMDALAKQDQQAMVHRYGGVEAASTLGSSGATPGPTALRLA